LVQNKRRDGQLIAKINKLEKELLVSTKECEVLSENLKSVEDKVSKVHEQMILAKKKNSEIHKLILRYFGVFFFNY